MISHSCHTPSRSQPYPNKDPPLTVFSSCSHLPGVSHLLKFLSSRRADLAGFNLETPSAHLTLQFAPTFPLIVYPFSRSKYYLMIPTAPLLPSISSITLHRALSFNSLAHLISIELKLIIIIVKHIIIIITRNSLN